MKANRAPTPIGFGRRMPSAVAFGRLDGASYGFRKSFPIRTARISRHGRSFPEGNGGFTLLETLIAVAIFLTLMILAGAGYQFATTKGKSVRNIGNHRAIISALIAYAQEHKGRLPTSFEDSSMAYTRKLVVSGYISNPRVFFSPLESDWYLKESAFHKPQTNAVTPWFYTNYAANRYGAMPYGVYQGEKRDGSRKPANLFRVAADGNLSKLMVLRDTYYSANKDKGGGQAWFDGVNHVPRNQKSYGGKVYASFADGHVEGFSLTEILKLMEDKDRQPPLYKETYTREN